jgi:putative intracellular protease/amidase
MTRDCLLLALGLVVLSGCAEPAADEPAATDEGAFRSTVRPAVKLQGDGSGGTILVVMSKSKTIDLKPADPAQKYLPSVAIRDEAPNDYITGVFARELSEPLRALSASGRYRFEFASEDGEAPSWDVNGLELPWFFWGQRDPLDFARELGGAVRSRDVAVSMLQEAFGPLVFSPKKSSPELEHSLTTWSGWQGAPRSVIAPKSLASVAASITSGSANYAALLVPGGHAPMSDLAFNADLGAIIANFHAKQKPIGVICHGPVALMSTLANTDYAKNVPGGWKWNTPQDRANRVADWHAMKEAGVKWEYAEDGGYPITIESTPEEQIMEMVFAGGRRVAYYVDGEMFKMGAQPAPAPGIEVPGLVSFAAFESWFKTSVNSGPWAGLANVISAKLDLNPALRDEFQSEKTAGRLWLPGLSKVTVHRELISGQSPASAYCVGVMMDRALRGAPDRNDVDCDGN